MKKLLTLLTFLSLAFLANAQSNIFSPPWCITSAPPTFHPGPKGCRVAIDTNTQRLYIWKVGTTWVDMGDRIQHVIGCSAPLYVPNKWQSNVVYNDCNPRQLFVYQGAGVWDEIGADSPVITDATLAGDGSLSTPLKIAQQAATLNQVLKWNGTTWAPAADAGTTYTGGTGIDVTGTVISNTGDLSAVNELITDFGVAAGSLGITDAGGTHNVVLTDIAPVQAVSAGTGISVSGTSTRTITNSAPDQTVSITGAGINAVTGTYPNFTVTGTEVDGSTTNELQNLSLTGQALSISGGTGVTLPLIGVGAGTGISVSAAGGSATVTNTAPDQTVVLTDGTGISTTGTYPNFTITNSAPSLWIDGGATTYLTATSDNVAIGTSTANSKLDVTTNGLGTTQTNTSGIVLSNNTAAAAGAQQISPALRFRAQGWKTDATAASQTVDFRQYLLPVQGTTAPTGTMLFQSSINGAVYTDLMSLTSTGRVGFGTSAPLDKVDIRNGHILLYRTDATFAQIGSYFGGTTCYGLRMEANSGSIASAPNGYLFQLGSSFSISHTGGGVANVKIPITFNPTSGNGQFYQLEIGGIINQTGGANGATRGMLINTVLTSAADWRALEIATAGNKGIYQTSSIPTNNFAGKTAFGSTGTPTEMIDVTGNGKFSGTVTGTNLISTATVRLKGYTVATLPAGVVGDQAYVTDALAPAYGVTVVGGGSVVTPVFFDGTNWTAR